MPATARPQPDMGRQGSLARLSTYLCPTLSISCPTCNGPRSPGERDDVLREMRYHFQHNENGNGR